MSTSTRTDVHRPGAIDPATYRYVGLFYQGPDRHDAIAYGAENRRHTAFLASASERDQRTFIGNWVQKNTCDLCGARFFHGAYFTHASGDIVHTGQDCAERLQLGGAGGIAQARAGVQQRLRIAAFCALHPGLDEALDVEDATIADVRSRLIKRGSISPKQVSLVFAIARRSSAPKAPAATAPAAVARVDAPAGDATITGIIRSIKEGGQMLVHDDSGFRCFGPVPAGAHVDLGLRVRFTANLRPTPNDPTFAYFRDAHDLVVAQGEAP